MLRRNKKPRERRRFCTAAFATAASFPAGEAAVGAGSGGVLGESGGPNPLITLAALFQLST